MSRVKDGEFKFVPHRSNSGFAVHRPRRRAQEAAGASADSREKGYLLAWDPVTQKEAWRVDCRSTGNGGMLVDRRQSRARRARGGEFVATAPPTARSCGVPRRPCVAGPMTYESTASSTSRSTPAGAARSRSRPATRRVIARPGNQPQSRARVQAGRQLQRCPQPACSTRAREAAGARRRRAARASGTGRVPHELLDVSRRLRGRRRRAARSALVAGESHRRRRGAKS